MCDVRNPDFSEFRYAEKIPYCDRNVSAQLKQEIYRKYGIPKKCQYRYTIDHFMPLSLGGDNLMTNLWPEHKLVKATRQSLEYDLYLQLKEGKITQRQAIDIIFEQKT